MNSAEKLLPISPAWVSPSILLGQVAICRASDGQLWLCQLKGESEGWEPIKPAAKIDVQAFQWSQGLAGNPVQPIPPGKLADE